MIFPGNIASKLPNVGTTIFTVMSALAREHNAINLSQGFPDFQPDTRLVEEVTKVMKAGNNQYAPMAGLLGLREKIAEKTEALYSAKIDPETEITITAGGTQALFTALLSVVKENDEVILFAPAYDSYAPAIELAGGRPIYYDLEAPSFTVDWQKVKKLLTQRTRMIIINTPHNPSGKTLNAFDMMQLEKITQGTDIIILSDEVYEHIIFDKLEHQSVLRFPKLAERSMVVNSFGKTYHSTGWKIGYCIAPKNLMAEFRKVHQFNVFSVNTPAQFAFSEMMQHQDLYLELANFYQQKRDFFREAIKASRFKVLNCEGTYFQLLSYKKISEEKDVDFAKRLTIEKGLATIPISVFYRHGIDSKVIRLCFAKENSTLEKAAEILCKI